MTDDLIKDDFTSIRDDLKGNSLSCHDLVDHFLQQIEAGEHLNAFLHLFPEEARRQAKIIDKKLKTGTAGPLAGLVIAIKDNLAIKDKPVTCGSKILKNFKSPYTATAVQRLIEADALVIGKTNMDEFAMGSSNENSSFGPVKNPHDETRVPGGSSGGSAVAVAADMALASLGSDTGGSIRQPAAMCGVVGLKPTYGRVSRFGLVAFASSFDQIGPFTKSVRDSALLLSVLAGNDPMDATSASEPVPDYFEMMEAGVKDLKIAYPKEYFSSAGLQPEIKQAAENLLRSLEQGGAVIEEISLPHSEYAIAAYYILANAEASSNLSRYDGVRYGYRDENVSDLQSLYELSRSYGFGEEVKRRIMMGTYVLSAGYYDAYYAKAQKVRTIIKREYTRAFAQYDGIIAPTTPTTAFKLGEKIDDPLQMYLFDIFTIPANLAGLNALSVPCGFDSNRLPVGLQVITKPFNEAMTFRIARFVEQLFE